MGIPITYNLRNLIQRKGTTLMTALGIGLTVAVLVTAVALTEGLRGVFAASGDPRQLLVLRKGTDAELTSSVSNDAYQIIRRLPGIALSPDGQPLISPEGLAVINLPSVDSPEGMNVTIRGMLPVGLTMRTITVEQGTLFHPGLRQVIVGEAISRRYPSARLGNQIRFGRGFWEVVGVFKAGDSAANSEIWLDLDQLRGDFDRQGESSSLLVRLNRPVQPTKIVKPPGTNVIDPFAQTLADDQRLAVSAQPEKEYYASLTSSGAPLMVLGFSVAVIMAFGSAFAATNTMYAAVSRRSREVGTLRALGFTRGMILRSFVYESIALALIGGIAGVLLALPINGLTTGVGSFTTFSDIAFKFKVSPLAIFSGLTFAALIGAVGGYLPARAAAKRDIIQAMRDA